MIFPDFCSRIFGKTALIICTEPTKFKLNNLKISSCEESSTEPTIPIPALLMRISILFSVSKILEIAFCTWALSVISVGMVVKNLESTFFLLNPKTLCPFFPKNSAKVKPIPVEVPVMMMIFFVSEFILQLLFFLNLPRIQDRIFLPLLHFQYLIL